MLKHLRNIIKFSLKKELIGENIINPQEIPGMMHFWHGGNLDYYDDSIAQKNGRYEFGPGLYATTRYDTAKKYAKGIRKFYLLTIEKGIDINDAFLDMNKVIEFINLYVLGSKKKTVLGFLQKYIKNNKVDASIFNNIILNQKAIPSTKTVHLRNFFVNNGIDYEIVNNPFGFGSENMIVLYNMKKIANILQVMPGDKIVKFDL